MDNAIVQFTTTRLLARRRLLLPLALILGAVLLGGCFGGGTPVTPDQQADLATRMIALEKISDAKALDDAGRTYTQEAVNTQDKNIKARDQLLFAYETEVAESREKIPVYANAVSNYQTAAKGGVLAFTNEAYYRIGMLGARGKLGSRDDSYKQAKDNLKRLINYREPILVRVIPVSGGMTPALAGEQGPATFLATAPAKITGPTLFPLDGATAVRDELSFVYRTGGGLDQGYYQIVDSIVAFFNRLSPAYGIVLALLFLAVAVKLVTLPLTNASFRGMRDMQRMQPLLKEIQTRYKDDQPKLAEAQMALYKEHNVNPMGGCLPMLIQLPIFIIVYQAVLVYSAGFASAHFLWIGSLAAPDKILLVLYAASMVVTQLLTATPTADPQQKMIQQQMTIMMPLMLYILLQPVASAFILYWFFLNVLSSVHQYYMKWKFKQEEVAATPALEPAPAPAPAPTARKKGKKA